MEPIPSQPNAPSVTLSVALVADLQDSLGQHGLESKRLRVGASAPQDTVEIGRTLAGEREGLRVGAASSSSSQDGAAGNGQRDRAPAREWSQEESRREQAARARDERQQQQDRQERQPPGRADPCGNRLPAPDPGPSPASLSGEKDS